MQLSSCLKTYIFSSFNRCKRRLVVTLLLVKRVWHVQLGFFLSAQMCVRHPPLVSAGISTVRAAEHRNHNGVSVCVCV